MATSKNLLLDVPPELTADVAARLPAKDLLTLRLVSKDVATLTEAAMLKANFSHLEVLFCFEPSLKRGLEIARHPVLKKSIRKITIVHNRFPPAGSLTPGQLKLTDLRPNTPVELRRESRCGQLAFYSNLIEQQEKIRSSGDDEKRVTDIFKDLSTHASLEVIVGELDVRVDPNGTHYCREGRSGVKQFDDIASRYGADLVMHHTSNHRALKAVLKAIRVANVHPKSFAAGGQTEGVSASLFHGGGAFVRAQDALSHLTRLKFCFESESPGAAAQSRTVTNVVSFLKACASTLQSLDLSMDDDSFGEREDATWCRVFERMTEDVVLPVVESLDISNVTADYKKCVKFFGDHGQQLKDYTLLHIRVTDCGPKVSPRRWKAKVKADLAQAGFPIGKGPVLFHHELYAREEPSDDESDGEEAYHDGDDDDSIDAGFTKAYPSFRTLITG